MSAQVFISFSSHDRKAAETIYKAVEQRGLQCWISSRNIGPGENFQEAITRAIRSAKVMILVFSANANNSLEVKKEIALAGRYNVIVVPVRVEDVVPNDALSYELAVRQWIDMFDNWEDAIERLVAQLSAVIQLDAADAPAGDGAAAAPTPAPAVPPPAAPPPATAATEPGRPSMLPIIAAAAVVILIVLGGAAWFLWPAAEKQSAQQIPAPAKAAPPPVAAAAAPSPPAPTTPSLREALAARLAEALPRLGEKAREDIARAYMAAPGHKAQAAPVKADGHWLSFDRRTPEIARDGGLEGCQVQYGEPCALLAVDDTLEPLPADKKLAARDMPRTHYAGEFDPAQIPGMHFFADRADVAGYRAAAAPKAAAFHPVRGRFFAVAGAANQYAAEQQALKRCNDDPVRNGAGGNCFLYAVDNRVVLPLRLREPMTAASVAAVPQGPPAAQSAPQAQPVAAAAPHPRPVQPKTFRDCPNCPEMVVVPAGKFEMGAADGEHERFEVPPNLAGFEQPRHAVTIGQPFALAKTEVTRGEFAAFVKATNFHIAPGCVAPGEARLVRNRDAGPRQRPLGRAAEMAAEARLQRDAELSWQNPGFPQTDRDPVVCVNGADINAYVEWLQKTTGKPYRLPSEAEFEYAARGGTTTPFYWGADPDKVCDYENIGDQTAAEEFRQVGFAGMPCRDGFVQTAPVGSFKPNPFGLYDMLGNVWEITADCWAGSYAGAPSDSSARTSGDCGMHAARKGSFGNGRPAFFRAAHRFAEPVGIKRNRSGFRVALSLN